MTAPARTGSGSTRARTHTKSTQTKQSGDRSAVTHNRSAAAERAYARRAGRTPGNRQADARTKADRRSKSTSASRVSFVILVMGLLVVGVAATLWLSTQSTADSLQLAQVNKNTQILAARVQQLQQAIAQGESPAQIAKLAQQLGMVPANNLAHVVVGPNGQITVVGTPSAATAPPPPPAPTSTDTDTTTANPPDGSTQSTAGG